MHPQRSSGPSLMVSPSGLISAVALGIVIVGCNPPLGAPTVPAEVVTPTTIGLIESSELRDEGRLVELEDGSSVLLPTSAVDLTGPAADGRLLIVGQGGSAAPDGGVWYAAVHSWSPDCFRIVANGEVRGEWMALSEGFSLRLSDDWDEPETTFVGSPIRGFCLDDSGAVVQPYP